MARFNTVTKAVVARQAQDPFATVLLGCGDAEVVQGMALAYRQVLTLAAASPEVTDEEHQMLMTSIRSIEIIDVRVDQIESL